MVGELRGVVVKRPQEAYRDRAQVAAQWQTLNYLGEPDFDVAAAQHAAFMRLLTESGAEICYAPEAPGTGLDSVYVHDPVIVCNRGLILGNMGKAARREEPGALGAYFEQLGLPVLGAISGDGLLEGGDVLWVNARTVAVAVGYRTNVEGIRQLAELLGDLVDEVIPVHLPHWTGPQDCLHLQSNISLIDCDLALVYSRLLTVSFRQWLMARGFQLIEVPDAEYDSLGCNVLALAPRQCVMLAGNPVTQARLEAAGAQVWTFLGSEICVKGAGGPTCLTRPFWRA
jgi:N-dimethylarginine dimethylaminohydrolase